VGPKHPVSNEKIQELSSTGRHQECLQACLKLLQSTSDNVIAWKGAGQSLLALGEFEKAIQHLIKAHRIDANDPETAKEIGNALLSLGRTDAAKSWYNLAIKINSNYAPAICNLGILERRDGNSKQSLNLFKRAIKADPKLTEAYLGASAILLTLKDLDQAELLATQANRINAGTPGINEILGIISQKKNNPQQAIEHYKKELTINPISSNSLQNLGLQLIKQGKNKEAVESLKRAAEIKTSKSCTLLLVQAYQNIGKFKEAMIEYKKLNVGGSDEKLVPFNLGIHFLSKNNNIDAIEAFTISIQVDDSFAPAWGNLGNALKQEGRLKEAIQATQKAHELDPKNSTILMNLGSIFEDLGDFNQALNSTLKSLELQPNNPTALMNLGSIYVKIGNFSKAIDSILKLLELKPNNHNALMKLGSIYMKIGNFTKAHASTLKSLELQPNNPTAFMNLGSIYTNLGNIDQALNSTLKSLELKPNNPTALMNLGSIYKKLGRIEEAKKSVYQALGIATNDLKLWTPILEFYDSINDEESLEKAIEFLKNKSPDANIYITMYEARLLFRRKNYEKSWEILPKLERASRDLKDWYSLSRYHAFRAQIAEKNNRYDEAYVSFEVSQKDPLYKSIDHKEEFYRLREYMALSQDMARDKVLIKNDRDQITSGSDPVFLIGFPRSGTTLLDTILRSHPNVEVLEEKDPLALAENRGINKLDTKISCFNSLKKSDLSMMRHAYLDRIKFHTKNTNKLIVDKLPLHTIRIPLIKLLFPNAKIIFALRHPCDSILSCFQQTFKPNTAMANFTTLERSVNYYDKVMNSWIIYNKNLEINYVTLKYEDLLDNFDESVSKVLKYLNLRWDDKVKDYRGTAMNRGHINTPSSSQVVQPLYKSSVGRWKNYQKYFAKHMDRLNPWINYFGYNI